MPLTDIHALSIDRARLQRVGQQLATWNNSLREGQGYLCAALEACLNQYGAQEQKCRDYYQSYKTMEAKYGSMINEMHSITTKNLDLHGEIEKAHGEMDKAHGIIGAANRRAEELEAVCTDLAETNVLLQQNLDQAREAIRVLENRTMALEPPPGVAIDSKNTDIHELDSLLQRSPEARIVEFKQPGDGDNSLDAQETNSIISCVSKMASPSPGDGGRQKVEGSKTIAEHGRQKQRKRGRARQRKLTPANPDLRISCG